MRKVGLYRHYYFLKGNRDYINYIDSRIKSVELFLSTKMPEYNNVIFSEKIDYIKTVVLCEVEVNDTFEVKE